MLLNKQISTTAIASIVIGSLAACGSDDPDTTSTSPARAATSQPTTGSKTTAAPDTTSIRATPAIPATTTEPVKTGAPATPPATTAPVTSWADGCLDEPLAPPFLNSGQPTGEPVLDESADVVVSATWGAGTPDQITQLLGSDFPAEELFDGAQDSDELIAAGDLESLVVPIGPPIGPIRILFRDADETCIRDYITPGSLGEEGIEGSIDEPTADTYAQNWLNALAN